LVPVSKLTATKGGLITAQKGTKSVIRLQYSMGANEANGFKHSTQLTLGVEITSTK
jgi:hypothetical protein